MSNRTRPTTGVDSATASAIALVLDMTTPDDGTTDTVVVLVVVGPVSSWCRPPLRGGSLVAMDYTPVTAAEIADLADLADWRFVLGAILADFRAGSFPAAASFVSAVAAAAEAAS
jgi:hypothetical protein